MTLTLRAKDWFHPDGFPLAAQLVGPPDLEPLPWRLAATPPA